MKITIEWPNCNDPRLDISMMLYNYPAPEPAEALRQIELQREVVRAMNSALQREKCRLESCRGALRDVVAHKQQMADRIAKEVAAYEAEMAAAAAQVA